MHVTQRLQFGSEVPGESDKYTLDRQSRSSRLRTRRRQGNSPRKNARSPRRSPGSCTMCVDVFGHSRGSRSANGIHGAIADFLCRRFWAGVPCMHSFPMRGTSLHHDEEILTGPPAPGQLGGAATLSASGAARCRPNHDVYIVRRFGEGKGSSTTRASFI